MLIKLYRWLKLSITTPNSVSSQWSTGSCPSMTSSSGTEVSWSPSTTVCIGRCTPSTTCLSTTSTSSLCRTNTATCRPCSTIYDRWRQPSMLPVGHSSTVAILSKARSSTRCCRVQPLTCCTTSSLTYGPRRSVASGLRSLCGRPPCSRSEFTTSVDLWSTPFNCRLELQHPVSSTATPAVVVCCTSIRISPTYITTGSAAASSTTRWTVRSTSGTRVCLGSYLRWGTPFIKLCGLWRTDKIAGKTIRSDSFVNSSSMSHS